MTNLNVYCELSNCCENCKEKADEIFGCIKCGASTCSQCSDGLISDWECICKECGW